MTTKTKVITLTVLAASLTSGMITIQDLSDDESSPVEVKLDQLSEEVQLALKLTEESPLLNTQRNLVTVTPQGMDGDVMLYDLHEALDVNAVGEHVASSPLREKNIW